MSEKTLTGQVALISGSGRGLGFAMAERLAELGAAVAVHDLSPRSPAEYGEHPSLGEVAEEIAGRFGVKTAAVTGDITDEVAVATLTRAAEDALGPLSILVNCAGGDIGARGNRPQPNDCLNIPLDDLRALLERNLVGTMLVCRAVCPGMIARKRGSVINIASTAAHKAPPGGMIYAVAKAGVVHWTRCLAHELRPHNVRVNAVSPGATVTARFLATRTPDPTRLDEDTNPLERYAKASEIADAVAFLASPAAAYISGQILRVDGGTGLFAA